MLASLEDVECFALLRRRPSHDASRVAGSRASSLTEPDLPTAHVTPRPSLTPSPYLPRGGSAHRDLRQPWSDRVPTAAASYDHHRQQAAPRDTSTVVTTADVMLARQDVARHGYLGYPGGAGYAYGRPQGYREADLSGAMGGDDCFDSMLSHWQQRHRDELRRQQLDVSQVTTHTWHAAVPSNRYSFHFRNVPWRV